MLELFQVSNGHKPHFISLSLDNDEPLMSGSGIVSKDITDENLLDSWHEALTKWHQNLKQKPKQVRKRRELPKMVSK